MSDLTWTCFICEDTDLQETYDGVCWNCRWTEVAKEDMPRKAQMMMVAKRGGYRDVIHIRGLVIIIDEE